jgi:hypothetical protein
MIACSMVVGQGLLGSLFRLVEALISASHGFCSNTIWSAVGSPIQCGTALPRPSFEAPATTLL